MRTASIEHASSVLKSWRYDDEGKVKMTVQYNPRREYSTLLIRSVSISASKWQSIAFFTNTILLNFSMMPIDFSTMQIANSP